MSAASPRRLKRFVDKQLGRSPRWLEGDGRERPAIPARALLGALLLGHLLRDFSYNAVEALARSRGRRALGIGRGFGDDTLAYFSARFEATALRQTAVDILKSAKRNKAFQKNVWIGLALDGTGAGHTQKPGCDLCHSFKNAAGEVSRHGHKLALISVVGCGLTLPFDVEPYGPGDSEYAASQRLLERARKALGPRFADYAVGDGAYATAPFLHAAGDLGLQVVARLKGNLPDLQAAVAARFDGQPPTQTFAHGRDRIEVWDAADFDPWESLRWKTVRVLRYRQHKPDGSVVTAEWLTDFSPEQASSQALFRMAKSRWEIENYGFNDAKNRHGLEHIPHHHPNSLLLHWLLILLSLTLERLFRLRYLHRGSHPVLSPIQLFRLLRSQLAVPVTCNSS